MKVKIIGYDHLARGIAKIDGKVIFIPKVKKYHVIDIDIVESKKRYDIGKNKEEKIEDPIFCPHYFKCGGCHLQHLTYEEQLALKCENVCNMIEKYTKYYLEKIEVTATKEKHYRNKVTLHVKDGILGFYKEKTHEIFSLEKCYLLKDEIGSLIENVKEFIKSYKGLEEVVIRALENEIAISFKGNIKEKHLIEYFGKLTTSIFYNGKKISGKDMIMTNILHKKFLVSIDSFFQVNDDGMIKIYQKVIDAIKEMNAKNVLDLYCGTGTISLLVSDYAEKVIGIEINEKAIENAMMNKKENNVENVKFYAGDVSKTLQKLTEKIDTIIVDPPRSGLDKKTKEEILGIRPESIIYISCNPLTLSRDINDLYHAYQLKEISLVDEFPQTYHVECVCVLCLR